MDQTTSVSPPPVRSMASPYYSSASANDQSSLFVSESPSPQRQRPHPNQWDSRPGAPPRNPSFTLPPLTPSLLNNNRSPIEDDPFAVYRNQGQNTWNYFSSGASGGNLNANTNGAGSRQPQSHLNPQAQLPRQGNDRFYIPRPRQQAQEEEPRLPTPQPPQPPQPQQGQAQGHLTPSRFDLPDGENYLTSTPDGGWNISDYSDAFDPSTFNDPSNYNGNFDQEDPFNFNWHSNQDNTEPEPRVLDQEGQRQLYQDLERALGAQARDQISQAEEQNRQYDEWERERVQRERRGRALREVAGTQQERARDNEGNLAHISPIAIENMPRETPNSGPEGRKRTAARAQSSEVNDGGAISPPPSKRSKINATSTSQQQSRNSDADRSLQDDLFGTPPPAEDEVDLVNVENDEDYEQQKEKRKVEELKRQREEEAARPVKLASQQCVICLDQPTGLVVTHCGTSSRRRDPSSLSPSAVHSGCCSLSLPIFCAFKTSLNNKLMIVF